MFVLAFLFGIALLMIFGPSDDPTTTVSYEDIDKTKLACKQKHSALANSYAVNSIADSTSSLSRDSIANFLMDRQLEYVEAKIRPGKDGAKPYIHPSNGAADAGWVVDLPPQGYAKVALSNQGDPHCIADPKVADSPLKSAFYGFTIPPGQCISVSHSPVPTASHLLKYEVDPKSAYGLLGNYQIVQIQTNSVLAELPTADNQKRPQHNGYIGRIGSWTAFNLRTHVGTQAKFCCIAYLEPIASRKSWCPACMNWNDKTS